MSELEQLPHGQLRTMYESVIARLAEAHLSGAELERAMAEALDAACASRPITVANARVVLEAAFLGYVRAPALLHVTNAYDTGAPSLAAIAGQRMLEVMLKRAPMTPDVVTTLERMAIERFGDERRVRAQLCVAGLDRGPAASRALAAARTDELLTLSDDVIAEALRETARDS